MLKFDGEESTVVVDRKQKRVNLHFCIDLPAVLKLVPHMRVRLRLKPKEHAPHPHQKPRPK